MTLNSTGHRRRWNLIHAMKVIVKRQRAKKSYSAAKAVRPPSNPGIEVLTEPVNILLARSSTKVEFNEDGNMDEEFSDVENIDESLRDTDEEDSEVFLADSYEDDFNTSSGSEGKDQIDESCPERLSSVEENLGNGIIIRYPESQRFEVPYVSRPLDQLMRNTQLATLKGTLVNSKFITDMYGIYKELSAEKGEQLSSLPIETKCTGEVRIFVTIKANRSEHFKYFAHLRRNETWRKLPVEMQGDVAVFEGDAFDILFLTSEPISETIILEPQGMEYTSVHDNNIKIIFPRNCVQQTEILTVQIIPQSDRGPICINGEPCIIGATKAVHVSHRKGIFKEQIEMQLDLYLFDESPSPDLNKYSFVDVHAINKQTKQMELYELTSECYTQNGKGFSLRVKVDDFDSHSCQLANHRKMLTETGKLRFRMAHDEIFHCHILVFVTRNRHNYQRESLRVECVENKQVQETIEKLSDNSYGFVELTKCRSPPIFIEDGERIRIGLRGGMKLPVGFRKDQMVITFLREGLHKHIVFPVETQFGNRPTSLGYLDFNRLDGKKELIYETFFDVDFPFGKVGLDANSVSPSPTPLGYRLHLTSPTRALSPDDQPSTPPYIIDKIIGALTNMLPPNEWKFILRAIIGDSGVEADNIISEAELNNKGNVKEAIYQSLRTWAQKTNLKTPKQKFDAIIQGLSNENYVEIASRLKAKYENNVI